MNLFISWILGAGSRAEKNITRTQRRSLSWCWNVEVPQPEVTGEVYTTLMVDGTYLQGWCLIVVYNGTHVVGWQWADKETKAAYMQALSRFPPPDIVVIDGHRGAFKAVKELWPHALIQRCFFHIKNRVRQLITTRPRTECGIEINLLTKTLMKISDPVQAAAWLVQYFQWETRWGDFLKERTYAGKRQRCLHDTRKWWWTHRDLRAVRGMYRAMIKHETLFSYLTPLTTDPSATVLPRTTSPLEGGINAGIKNLLQHHRGLSVDHARRAVDWYLNSKTEHPIDPASLIKPEHYTPNTVKPAPLQEPDGPPEYDDAVNPAAPWEDGVWIRKGWAGR